MNISKGNAYNIRRRIERSIINMQMDARRRHKIIPRLETGEWGITYNDDKSRWELEDSRRPVCCPMAAVLLYHNPEPVNRRIPNEDKTAAKVLGIREADVANFITGFDGDHNSGDYFDEFVAIGVALNKKYVR